MIKKFNEYNSEYYWEITSGEKDKYWNDVYYKLGITQDLYTTNKKAFASKVPHFTDEESKYLIGLGFKFESNSDGIIFKSLLTGYKDEHHYYIYKSLDEWYIVWVYMYKKPSKYYKCDQWDGLMKFLDDFGLDK